MVFEPGDVARVTASPVVLVVVVPAADFIRQVSGLFGEFTDPVTWRMRAPAGIAGSGANSSAPSFETGSAQGAFVDAVAGMSSG